MFLLKGWLVGGGVLISSWGLRGMRRIVVVEKGGGGLGKMGKIF